MILLTVKAGTGVTGRQAGKQPRRFLSVSCTACHLNRSAILSSFLNSHVHDPIDVNTGDRCDRQARRSPAFSDFSACSCAALKNMGYKHTLFPVINYCCNAWGVLSEVTPYNRVLP